MTNDDVHARLEKLESIEAARNVTQQYARAIDSLDWALLTETFTDDANLISRSSSHVGREAVIANYRRALEAPLDRKHFIINTSAEWMSRGEVIVNSYFIYTFAGDETSVLGWGNYTDQVRIENGVARIAEKRISVDRSGSVLPGWMN
jgi:hypothetical protein